MPVIVREAGFRVIIYLDDHPPAHVHVEGNDGSTKIAIEGAVLVWNRGLNRRDVNRAVDIVSRHHNELRTAWTNIHG